MLKYNGILQMCVFVHPTFMGVSSYTHAHTHACTHTRTHTHTHAHHTCTHTFAHTHAPTHMHAGTHIHTHTHVHTHTHTHTGSVNRPVISSLGNETEVCLLETTTLADTQSPTLSSPKQHTTLFPHTEIHSFAIDYSHTYSYIHVQYEALILQLHTV